MATSIELEVATPERLLIRETVRETEIPAANGYIGVLPEHSPLLSELGTGELYYVGEDGRRKSLAVEGGWVEVLPNHVRVLALSAEKADEIDVQRAGEALKRAAERLDHPELGVDVARALNAMKRAQARVDAASHQK